MTELTPEKLAELKRLLDEATPRPWEAYHPHPHYRQYAVAAVTPEGHLGYAVATTQDVQAEANAELIVAAVNALPVLLDAAAERDALAAKLDAVRALHGPRVVQVLGATCSAEECDHEDACPLVDYTVCGHCYDVGDGAHPYAYEDGGLQDVAHPCATYRALDATPETGCES